MKTNTKHWAGITAGILSLAGYASAASLGSEKYTYDASGNVVAKKIGDQMIQFSFEGNTLKKNNLGTTYLHDDAGRLVGESRDGRVERKLSYQFGDKVTRVEKGGNTAEFYYNAEGQLVGKNAGGQAETFAWDDRSLVMRGNQAYVNEEHVVGGVPAMIGKEVAVSDRTGNTLSVGKASIEATAFGQGLEGGLFTGKPFVKELEGFVFKHRNYSAKDLRWTTADPSGFPDGFNNYQYALANPNSFVDPYGLDVEWATTTETGVTGTNPLGSGTSGLTTPSDDPVVGATISQTGDHKVDTVGACYQPAFQKAQKYSGSIKIEYALPGSQIGGDYMDTVSSVDTLTHEHWHESHIKTVSTKTYAKFETWWTGYTGNKFGTQPGADSAGRNDRLNGHNNAYGDAISLCHRSAAHEGLTQPDLYSVVGSDGLHYQRSHNPDWGQSLMDSINLHKIQFAKVAGTCEQ